MSGDLALGPEEHAGNRTKSMVRASDVVPKINRKRRVSVIRTEPITTGMQVYTSLEFENVA
jgi:hypothetical protein